jgi:crotonobetainyl-CoA:carnitine CoA-transferase CaiB-like acyl-CoA transferase
MPQALADLKVLDLSRVLAMPYCSMMLGDLGAEIIRVEMEHPKIGKFKLVGSPMKLSETPVQYRIPPPLLGEHTEEILRDALGYDKETIARFKEAKVI